MPSKGLSRLAIAFVLAIFLPGCSDNTGTQNAYVTLPTVNRVLAFRVNNKNGQLARVFGGTFDAGMSPSAVAAHPTNRFVYVANSGENDIGLYSVDSSSGDLREVLPRTPAFSNPIALAIDPAGAFLYVVSQGFDSVSSYSIDPDHGTLTLVPGSLVSAGLDPASIAVTPSGKYLYVPNSNSNSISAYSTNGGALQPVAGSPFAVGTSPLAIAIDPAEHFVFVTNVADSTFSVLSIDSTTGALTNIVGSPFNVVQINNTGAATGAVSIAVHPSGTLLYIANQITGDITFYSITSSGVAIEQTISPFASGHGINFVVCDTTGKYLFVGNQSNKHISVYNIDATTGALTLSSLIDTIAGATQMVVSK
jgi:6-phosphogluconolactonase (cycloisomerase 2 family)